MLRTTITLMFLMIINLFSYSGYAATTAGTRIVNQAEATFSLEGSDRVIRVVSNFATLVVAPLLAVDQDQDQEVKSGPGELVYFPHTIINTGNQPDTYTLSATNLPGDNGDLLNIQIYLDENGDGQVNPGERPITQSDLLRPGVQIEVVVAGTIPDNAQPGDQYSIELETVSQQNPEVRDRDQDTATVDTESAIIAISRITDTDCALPLKLNDRSYHEVTYTNNGNKPPKERDINLNDAVITGVLIQESIPEHLTLLKEPAFFTQPTTGLLLVGTPLGEWLTYEQWNPTTVIDKLGVLLPTGALQPNQGGKYGYTYQVTSLPLEGEGTATDRKKLEIRSSIDSNVDGRPDYQSNTSCVSLAFQEFIKERPKLVLQGTVFDTDNLTGLPGYTVTLYTADDNLPVATAISDAQGLYTFPDLETGDYYIQPTTLSGFVLSSQPPDEFTTFTVTQSSYGLTGFDPEGENPQSTLGVFNLDPERELQVIDIPVDREVVLGPLTIDKSASTQSAGLGEPIAYTVIIRNLTQKDLYATQIEDLLPAGFKYLAGTAKIDGEYTDDPALSYPEGKERTQLNFRIGDFLTDAEHTLTYIAQATALAISSEGINTASVYGDTITGLSVTSPTASAQVVITQDGVLSDQAIMFGRVAVQPGCKIGDDSELSDSGYPLSGVRLYLEDGTYVITDSNGQYSLYGLQPGLRVLKVDAHSLPQGVDLILTENTQAGDPDSHFIDLVPGDFYRADFMAACPKTITRVVESCPQPAPVAAAQAPLKKPKQPVPAMVRHCVDKPVEKRTTKMVTRTIKNVINPVHFASGKAVIPANYAAKLQTLINQTKDKKNVHFRFVGHTDNQPLTAATQKKFGNNQGLSEARASEVAEHVLHKLNIQTRVSVEGKGETQPVASNETAQGMTKNRRVELVMVYDEPKVTLTRSSKKECRMKPAAPSAKPAPTSQNKKTAKQQQQPQKKQALQQPQACVSKTITETHPVVRNILSRSKTSQLGWDNEIEAIDPANTSNLRNVSRLADKNGDISNGLVDAFRNRVNKHQHQFAQQQKQLTTEQEQQAPAMPDPKEAVKTITRAQGKAGTWLWPLGDTSLDGRFMAVVRSGVTPALFINGKAVATSQLGEQIENRKAKAQILAWYGVQLDEGENTLKITAKGPFGNQRTLAEKVVRRPSSGVAIKLETDGTLRADGGRSTIPVTVRILDSNGYDAKGTYFLTLEASDGTWAEPDIQDKVPGHQVKVSNGQRTVHLRSSSESGQIKLRASTGKLQSETDVAQVAELRPLIAVGLLNLRAHQGYREGYENLGLIQLDEHAEDTEVSGRAALFMKGRIKGDMHLTLSYDSEKDPDAELLRDIDPQEYYQVYGDASLRGFEAQSRSQLYAKLEKDRHSLMWGDYITDNDSNGADIARVQRTLTGVNGIFDNGKTRLQVFAAEQNNPRGFEEIPGNGTAMLYQLASAPIVENSEVVEIITRDRANIGLILSTDKLQRFRDYSIDDVSGFLTFHRVIPTLDDELNPVSVRITYDRIEENEEYLVAGVRLMHRLSDNLNIGASYTHDENATDGYQIAGVFTEYSDETTQLELGAAKMSHEDGTNDGQAVRLKATKKWTEGSRTELIAAQADAEYTNNTGGVIADRREIKLSQHQQLGDNLQGKAELSHSESLSTEEQRQSLELSVTTQLDAWKLKGGVRQIRQTTDSAEEKINTALVGVERDIELFDRKGSIKAEYEREIGDADRQRVSVGADMHLTDKTEAYIRYEQADRLSSGTLSGAVDTQNNLVAGVKSQVLPSTEMYSEYRIEGDISGEDVVLANGAKATLNLEENLVITPSIEYLTYLEGEEEKDSIAASIGLRDTRDPNSKKLLRAETRHNDEGAFYGLNGTYVQKLNDTTTVMIQDEMRLNQYDDEREDNLQNTLTLAGAHRPAGDGRYNALYAYKWDTDDSDNRETHVLSTHQHYRISESVDISGRLGAKKKVITQEGVDYASEAIMADARAQFEVTDRIGIDVHGGVLASNGSEEMRYSAGAGVTVNVVKNLQIGAGYNFTGFEDQDLDADGRNAKGAYVGLQYKVDESLFGWLSGDERPLVNIYCEPDHKIELTDAELLEKQRQQIEDCRQERGYTGPYQPINSTPEQARDADKNTHKKGVQS